MRTVLTIPQKGKENKKTGLMPVSTTSADSCPPSCGLFDVCYAKSGPLLLWWRKVSDGRVGVVWDAFCRTIAALPLGQIWRHNQAGDLPGVGDTLDTRALGLLVKANRGRRGFTYTHKPLRLKRERAAIAAANAAGFTINLSGNTLRHADRLAELGIGPMVVALPLTVQGNVRVFTPAGRRVVVCPATYREDTTCLSCQLCQVATRNVIVGFPAHGGRKRLASALASL